MLLWWCKSDRLMPVKFYRFLEIWLISIFHIYVFIYINAISIDKMTENKQSLNGFWHICILDISFIHFDSLHLRLHWLICYQEHTFRMDGPILECDFGMIFVGGCSHVHILLLLYLSLYLLDWGSVTWNLLFYDFLLDNWQREWADSGKLRWNRQRSWETDPRWYWLKRSGVELRRREINSRRERLSNLNQLGCK